MNDVVEELN